MLLDSLHYAKSSLTSVHSRSLLVSCAPFSMFGGLGGTQVSESDNIIYYNARLINIKKVVIKTCIIIIISI